MQDLSKEVALNPLALIGTRGTEKMLKLNAFDKK